MSLINIKILIFILSWLFVFAEDPFCNNKCSSKGLTFEKVCYCDLLCATLFNDCCGDSKQLLNKYGHMRFKSGSKMSCKQMNEKGMAVLTIDKCSKVWTGPEEIYNSCVYSSNATEDPLSALPVSNPLTGVTYSNYYCAICNDAMTTRVFWEMNFNCPTLKQNMVQLSSEEAIQHLAFDPFDRKWGFVIFNHNIRQEVFHSCNISYDAPKDLVKKVRKCNQDLISECLPPWKDDLMKRMCGKYIDPVYTDDGQIQYKNLYCAVCNKADISRLSCRQGIRGRQHKTPVDPKQSLNFAMLLDMNLGDGNTVGETKCNGGQIYDPFFKKCRNIVCKIPGDDVKFGKCSETDNYSKF